jgi:hypothetical protein
MQAGPITTNVVTSNLARVRGTHYVHYVIKFVRSNSFWVGFMVMVLNTNFNNSSAISWWSVLLVEETGVPGENHGPDKLDHIMYIMSTPHPSEIRSHNVSCDRSDSCLLLLFV